MKALTIKKIRSKVKEYNDFMEKQGFCYDITKLRARLQNQRFSLSEADKLWGEFIEKKSGKIDFFVNIPFCYSKCAYCHWPSWVIKGKNKKIIVKYIDYLLDQADFFKKRFDGVKFKCFSIGGGSPNIVGQKDMERLLSKIFGSFEFAEGKLRNFEYNPSFVKPWHFKIAKKYGANRITFGVQSFSSRTLKENNRGYQTYRKVENAINLAKKAGFKEINADLILGFPSETADDFIESFKKLAKIGPTSIVIYNLKPPQRNDYLSKWDLDRKEFYTEIYPKFIQEVAAKISEVADKAGYDCKNSDLALFHWGSRRKNTPIPDFFKEEYRSGLINNVFGLGFCSISHLKGIAEFRQTKYQEKLDANEKIFTGRKMDPKDEMFRFVIDNIDFKSEIPLKTFESVFSVPLEKAFPRAIYCLKKLKVIEEKKGSLVFSFKEPKDKYVYASFFANEQYEW